ncbi:glycosyltransferase family 4 protein [Roseibium sp.]|uniref:glycosyltransferase family 4 protein n=1 Tax=Roseibium sp. TaxID=1936156 RepID=UPI003B52C349
MPADKSKSKVNIMFLGLRGIPKVQGGIEKHVEHLAPLIVDRGLSVEVVGRSAYLPEQVGKKWQGVALTWLPCPKNKFFETIFHTFFGVCRAAWTRPDVLHLHAVGPALMTPVARLAGLKVAVTHHGYDYNRDKWGPVAKAILKAGEYLGMKFANLRIAISKDISTTMKTRYGVDVHFVPNGMPGSGASKGAERIEAFGLKPANYIMVAARLVPEKRQLDLIKAYARMSNPGGIQLAVVGGSDHPDEYEKKVRIEADKTPGVVMTGFQSGEALSELFANARLFVLPSSHEGMPIALLEALGYGLPVLASDIVPNKEIGLCQRDYFPVGDINELTKALERKLADPMNAETKREQIERFHQMYGWDTVAEETFRLYRGILHEKCLGSE